MAPEKFFRQPSAGLASQINTMPAVENSMKIKGDGPALIMLHGWGQTARAMIPLAESLENRFRVITLDLPGHGGAKGDKGPYTFERYVATVREIAEKLGGAPFHLIGWSMGGTIAALYALSGKIPAPSSLILISATPKFVIPDKNLGMGQHPAAVRKMEKMILADPRAGLSDFVSRFFESGEVIAENLRGQISGIFFGPDFPPEKEALIETLRELNKADLTVRELPAASPPVLLIYGRADKICLPGGQRLWRAVFEDVEEHPLEGAGHAPQLTRRDEVARAIEDFVQNPR